MLEYLRLVPVELAGIPRGAIVARADRASHMVVDTRGLDGDAALGRVMTLTELFSEMNK